MKLKKEIHTIKELNEQEKQYQAGKGGSNGNPLGDHDDQWFICLNITFIIRFVR